MSNERPQKPVQLFEIHILRSVKNSEFEINLNPLISNFKTLIGQSDLRTVWLANEEAALFTQNPLASLTRNEPTEQCAS